MSDDENDDGFDSFTRSSDDNFHEWWTENHADDWGIDEYDICEAAWSEGQRTMQAELASESAHEGTVMAEEIYSQDDELTTLSAKVAELEARQQWVAVRNGNLKYGDEIWAWAESRPNLDPWECVWAAACEGFVTHYMPRERPTPPTEDKPGQVLPEWQGAGEYLEGKGDE